MTHFKPDYIKPACLPISGVADLVSGPVTLTGWGTPFGGGLSNRFRFKVFIIRITKSNLSLKGDLENTNSLVPRKAAARILSNPQCEATNNFVTSGNICVVGDPSGSACVVS